MSSLIWVSRRFAFVKWSVNGEGCGAKGFFVSNTFGSQSLGRFWRAKLFSSLIGINKFVRGIIERVLTWVGAAFCSFIEWRGVNMFCGVVAFSLYCWCSCGGVSLFVGLDSFSGASRSDAS